MVRKDKPIVAAGRPGHPQLAKLPEWPDRTIAVLCTTDGRPHAIPVAAPVRADDQRILVSLERTRGSLARLRENPQVALAILSGGNVAFTALGRAVSSKNQCYTRWTLSQSKLMSRKLMTIGRRAWRLSQALESNLLTTRTFRWKNASLSCGN